MISHIQHAEWIAQKVETRQIELKTLTAARG
jgi:hypothetical protein